MLRSILNFNMILLAIAFLPGKARSDVSEKVFNYSGQISRVELGIGAIIVTFKFLNFDANTIQGLPGCALANKKGDRRAIVTIPTSSSDALIERQSFYKSLLALYVAESYVQMIGVTEQFVCDSSAEYITMTASRLNSVVVSPGPSG